MNDERYAIPGFQQVYHPKMDERVFAQSDGLVDFMFLDNLPAEKSLPAFTVYIDAERGREINRLALTDTNRFIYEKAHEHNNMKSWWFRMRTDVLDILPGTYRVRFVVNGQELVQKSLTIHDHPALPHDPLDQNREHWLGTTFGNFKKEKNYYNDSFNAGTGSPIGVYTGSGIYWDKTGTALWVNPESNLTSWILILQL